MTIAVTEKAMAQSVIATGTDQGSLPCPVNRHHLK